ncbi:MAG: hypothetical protein V8Q30_03160 [Acutalibacteraceae bacterium]
MGYTDFWKSSASLNEMRPLVLLHIPDGASPQTLVLAFVDVGVVGDDLPQHIEIHTLLEQERAHASGEIVQGAGEHGGECFGQEASGVLRVQIADVKPERILHEFAPAGAVVEAQVDVYLLIQILRIQNPFFVFLLSDFSKTTPFLSSPR